MVGVIEDKRRARLAEAREIDQRTAELDQQRGELIASVIGMTFAASGLPDGAVGVLMQVCARLLRSASSGDVLAVDPAIAEQAQRDIRRWVRDDAAAGFAARCSLRSRRPRRRGWPSGVARGRAARGDGRGGGGGRVARREAARAAGHGVGARAELRYVAGSERALCRSEHRRRLNETAPGQWNRPERRRSMARALDRPSRRAAAKAEQQLGRSLRRCRNVRCWLRVATGATAGIRRSARHPASEKGRHEQSQRYPCRGPRRP